MPAAALTCKLVIEQQRMKTEQNALFLFKYAYLCIYVYAVVKSLVNRDTCDARRERVQIHRIIRYLNLQTVKMYNI